jgi:hypothetical protein
VGLFDQSGQKWPQSLRVLYGVDTHILCYAFFVGIDKPIRRQQMEYDTTVTKQQIAGILRKANIVRYKKVAGGKSVLRDITRNYAYYSGVEVIEKSTSYNKNPRTLRPRYIKVSTGKFTVEFTHGYNGQKFTQEEAKEILNKAIAALIDNGFIVVDDHSLYFVVAKEAK